MSLSTMSWYFTVHWGEILALTNEENPRYKKVASSAIEASKIYHTDQKKS